MRSTSTMKTGDGKQKTMTETAIRPGLVFWLAIGLGCVLGWLPLQKATASEVTLIPAGDFWHYWDQGIALSNNWAEVVVDGVDPWPMGIAEFGYGDGDEETEVFDGGVLTNRFITTYFRKSFVVDSVSAYASLKVSLRRDDGAVVYLNGVEVIRDNLPATEIEYGTLALTNIVGDAEDMWQTYILPTTALVDGVNMLAVEVHQWAPYSADLSFDLSLKGDLVRLIRGPYLQNGTTRGMTIRWRTDAPTIGVVSYGTNPSAMTRRVAESVPVTDHEIRIEELEPDTRYFYSVGMGNYALASGTDMRFRTAPGTQRPIRAWVIGDSGTGTIFAKRVYESMLSWIQGRDPDIWLLLGDNAYHSGTDAEYQTNFFQMYPALLRRSVVWPTLGNHETYSSDGKGAYPYLGIFSPPTQGEAGGVPSGTKRYYSYDFGPVHFVVLDSMTHVYQPGVLSPMLQWLEADLAATERPWTVVYFHHPPYTKGSHDSDIELDLILVREQIVPILERYGVDLVMSGHSHSYERSHFMKGHYGDSETFAPEFIVMPGDGSVDGTGAYIKTTDTTDGDQGTVYVVNGSSGLLTLAPLNHPANLVSRAEMGSSMLDVTTNRLDLKFININGVVRDQFTILKGSAAQFVRITSIQVGDTDVALAWITQPGVNYVVEVSGDITSGSWTRVGEPIQSASPRVSVSYPRDRLPQPAFFRIVSDTPSNP